VNFSTSQLALVAYALVDGSDASLVESNGFVTSTKVATGVSVLFLSTALAQDLVAGKCRDLLVVTPGKSNGALNPKTVAASNITSTAIMVALGSSPENTDFSILVMRTVLPPATP
jgi:hypothetical protein